MIYKMEYKKQKTLYVHIYIQDVGAGILEERSRPSYFCQGQIMRNGSQWIYQRLDNERCFYVKQCTR